MFQEILDPLGEYENVFKPRFEEVAKNTFEELAKEAKVDIEANKKTCTEIYDLDNKINCIIKSISKYTNLFALFLIFLIASFIFLLYFIIVESRYVFPIIVAFMICFALFVYYVTKIDSKLKDLKNERLNLINNKKKLKGEAFEQMYPLNRLYDWDILVRMMTKAIPNIQFDPYFTNQRLADLEKTYGWTGSFNKDRSVIYSHSGLVNGNPFIICQTRKMEMGTKVYTGSETIYWTTRERGADGEYHTVSHSETLEASVSAPYPMYKKKTRLIYGNEAAPDLIFSRKQSGLASAIGTFRFNHHLKSLRKKSRDLTDCDYAMMTNEDFEVAFDTSNRNNNQQYALLFTALAQENMMKLLQDDKIGFGDDFDFAKYKMINTIVPNHIQKINLDMNPKYFENFDYEKARLNFYDISVSYFRAIYFSLAPLLCIPIYQQIRPQDAIYGRQMKIKSSFWEHEALANFWGQDNFKHPDCVTDCILKTSEKRNSDNSSTITVSAHGYRVAQRVTYVEKWGGDLELHRIPVYWDEYFPIVGTGIIHLQEDNNFNDENISNSERLKHIDDMLNKSQLNIYRRHIVSRL